MLSNTSATGTILENEVSIRSDQAYLDANPDLVVAGFKAAEAGVHFAVFGRNEGRLPSFDAAGYVLLNPDLIAAGAVLDMSSAETAYRAAVRPSRRGSPVGPERLAEEATTRLSGSSKSRWC